MIIEHHEYVEMLTPFRNCCQFRLAIDGDKKFIQPGCCCYINLLTGAARYVFGLTTVEKSGMVEIKDEEAARKILEMKPCPVCGGTLFSLQKKMKN